MHQKTLKDKVLQDFLITRDNTRRTLAAMRSGVRSPLAPPNKNFNATIIGCVFLFGGMPRGKWTPNGSPARREWKNFFLELPSTYEHGVWIYR